MLICKRLFVRSGLTAGVEVDLDPARSTTSSTSSACGEGDRILVFNGRDGEWLASLGMRSRKACLLRVERAGPAAAARRPTSTISSHPLKQARLDYMVEKATEMGAGRLRPVLTQHGQVTRINLERMRGQRHRGGGAMRLAGDSRRSTSRCELKRCSTPGWPARAIAASSSATRAMTAPDPLPLLADPGAVAARRADRPGRRLFRR